MAETRLDDVYTPDVWNKYMNEKTAELTRFWDSGIAVTNNDLASLVNGGGTIIDMPFFNDLVNEPEDVVNDNPSQKSDPSKITSGKEQAHLLMRAKSWSAMDITKSFAGADPIDVATSRYAYYWARREQACLNACLTGIITDNVANDSSDMVHSIWDGGDSTSDSTQISSTALLDAAQTLGDAKHDISTLIVNSQLDTTLQKNNLNNFTEHSDGKTTWRTYLGWNYVVDDGMPKIKPTGKEKNFSQIAILCKRGAFAYQPAQHKVPFETEREPSAGNGGGQEIVYTRKAFVLHPLGYSFDGAKLSGKTPTNAELAAAARWSRMKERKKIGIAALACSL